MSAKKGANKEVTCDYQYMHYEHIFRFRTEQAAKTPEENFCFMTHTDRHHMFSHNVALSRYRGIRLMVPRLRPAKIEPIHIRIKIFPSIAVDVCVCVCVCVYPLSCSKNEIFL